MNALALAERMASLQTLGLALLITLWHSTALTLVVVAASRTKQGSAPQRRHAISLTAQILSLALGVATWFLLAHPPEVGPFLETTTGLTPMPSVTSGSAVLVRAPTVSGSPWTGEPAATWAGWLAFIWLGAVALLMLRFTGGLLMTWWIRRRAVPLPEGPVAASVRRLCQAVGLRRAVEVAESADLECPAAIGWRRLQLLLPAGIDITLKPSSLEPVLAHELEHLRRRDHWAALLQTLTETLLFFCPGVHWLGRSIREAREQHCDDAAVRVCGDSAAYAAALGVLANRVTGTWANAVLGSQAPSLVRRIKRIIKGDTMQPLNRGQWLGVLTALMLTVVTGTVMFAAALDAARVAAHVSANGTPTSDTQAIVGGSAVPTALAGDQPGAPLRVIRVTGDQQYCFTQVSVRNASERVVTSVMFAAVVTHRREAEPAIVVRSAPLALSLEPGATADLSMTLLPVAELLEWKSAKGYLPQAMLGLVEVGFANGDKWVLTPPADAVTANDVFHAPRPEVSRALLSKSQPVGRFGDPCRDDRGLTYSEGAIVQIKAEPDAFALCTNGGWVEKKREDLVLQCELSKDGQVVARPTLRIASGQSGSLSYRDELTATLTPTRLRANEIRLALTIEAAGKTVMPELTIGDQPGIVSVPAGKVTYTLRFFRGQ
jgi:beta-lactamase regulating signal transducer with metallopeptidase domain